MRLCVLRGEKAASARSIRGDQSMWDAHWMANVLYQVLLLGALVCTVPVAFILIEIMNAKRVTSPPEHVPNPDIRSVLIIPAHNEELELRNTLSVLTRCQPPTTRILVVADHCTDDTVRIAKSFHVDLIERKLPSKPGKSHALSEGVCSLANDPPDVVVMMDADCQFVADGLTKLIVSTHTNQRPEQAIYRMAPPRPPTFHSQLSAFAFQLKNEIRAKGLAAMNAPCHLTGSGMAFPWQHIRTLSLQSESLVEDLELGILLTARGTPAHLNPGSTVLSKLPQSAAAALKQRRRWEHGYLRTMVPGLFRLVQSAIQQRDPKLMLLALDLCIPPLSFLSLTLGAGWSFALLSALFSVTSWALFSLWSLIISLFIAAILLATWRYPGAIIRPKELTQAPRYLLWKIPVMLSFFYRPERNWQRTERTNNKTFS